jgi:hypothetical protein
LRNRNPVAATLRRECGPRLESANAAFQAVEEALEILEWAVDPRPRSL